MRTMRLFTVIVAWLSCPGLALGQRAEAGVGVSVSCGGLDGVPCYDVWGRVASAYGGWWVSPSIELELRVARLDGPDGRIVAIGEQISPTHRFYRSYTLRREEREVFQISLLYHFLEGRPVRPFAGGGVGYMWWNGDATCATTQISCAQVLPNGQPGPVAERGAVITVAGGVAFSIPKSVMLRTGLRSATSLRTLGLHFNGRDEPSESSERLQLPEFFVSVGYRW